MSGSPSCATIWWSSQGWQKLGLTWLRMEPRWLETSCAGDADGDRVNEIATFLRHAANVLRALIPHPAGLVYARVVGQRARDEPAIGTFFADRYLVEAVLGRGGMGAVYRVHDEVLGEAVALKILVFGGLDDRDALDRFRREVRLSRRVTHANVARTFDLGEHEGLHYLTMEFVEGRDLAAVLREEGPLSIQRSLRYGCEIAAGLAAAHEAGVIHRDLKPRNVLLDENQRVKLTDFGIARPVAEDDGLETRGIVGTPAYMAPEQVRAESVDARTDLYALGLVLYEMITGRRPFSGKDAMSVAIARLENHPADPRTLSRVPDPLAELVMRCLARAPAERPGSAREVGDHLVELAAMGGDDIATKGGAPHRTITNAEHALTSETIASAPSRNEPRLAILPFVYRGPEEHAYLGDTLTDELIDVLCRTRGLTVLASGATAGYRDERDPRQVGRELDVDAVVDGTVQSAGSRVRISTRLCDARSGIQLASERCEGEIADIFELQDSVCRCFAEALRVSVDSVKGGMGGMGAPDEAVELYLRARKRLRDLVITGEDGAVVLLERAVLIAPDFAPAAAAHAIACLRAWFVPKLIPNRDFEPEARGAVLRALAIAPQLAETHFAAALLAKTDGDYHETACAFRNALAIAPAYASAIEGLGVLECETGRPESGRKRLKLAIEIDPSLSLAWIALAREHALDGDREAFARAASAIESGPQGKQLAMYQVLLRDAAWRGDSDAVREVVRVLPHSQSPARQILAAYAGGILGELTEQALLAAIRDAIAESHNPRFTAFAQQLAVEACTLTGHREAALEHLTNVSERMLVDLAWLEQCSALAPLRGDPGFAKSRARVRERVDQIWTI